MQSISITPLWVLLLNGLLILAFFWFAACLLSVASGREKHTVEQKPGLKKRLFGMWLFQNRLWGIFFLILGVQFYWIDHYLVNIPFWDQWGAEGDLLYLPFLREELHLGMLLYPHNEHRIFWTRVWALGQFLLNGQWDIHFQAFMNAIWKSAAGAVFCEVFYRYGGKRGFWFWAALFLVLFAGPYGGENLVFPFQSQFYFLQYFGLASVILIFGARPLSLSWFTGWVGLAFSFLSLSGGVLLIGAVLVAAILRLIFPTGKRRWELDTGWVLAAFFLFVIALRVTPIVTHDDPARAETLGRFVTSFIYLLSWPNLGTRIPLGWASLCAILLWSPWVLYALSGLVKRNFRKAEGRYYWVLVAWGGWIWSIAVAAAYSRGNLSNYGYNARYADLFGLGMLLFVLVAFRLGSQYLSPGSAGGKYGLIAASAILWVIGFYNQNLWVKETLLPLIKSNGEVQIQNVNRYVQTGDGSNLQVERRLDLPYPDRDKLRRYLDDPLYRSILPYTVRETIPLIHEAVDPASPFLAGGVPDTVDERPGEQAWGSYHPERGGAYRARSQYRLSRSPGHPFLVFYLAGYPERAENRLLLERSPGDTSPVWRTAPGDRWLDRRIWAGDSSSLLLRATDGSRDSWFAFSEPREMGFYSFVAVWTTKHHLRISGLGLIILLLPCTAFLIIPDYRRSLIRSNRRFYASVRAFIRTWRNFSRDRPE